MLISSTTIEIWADDLIFSIPYILVTFKIPIPLTSIKCLLISVGRPIKRSPILAIEIASSATNKSFCEASPSLLRIYQFQILL